MNSKLLIGTFSCLLFLSCNESSQDESTTELANLIVTNQAKWQASNISTYAFTYYSAPNDCPTVDPFPAVEITIENNKVTDLYVPELGTNLHVSDYSYPTIGEIFAVMIDSIDVIVGEPTFDENFGFPTNYETDVSVAECDGFSVTLSAFI